MNTCYTYFLTKFSRNARPIGKKKVLSQAFRIVKFTVSNSNPTPIIPPTVSRRDNIDAIPPLSVDKKEPTQKQTKRGRPRGSIGSSRKTKKRAVMARTRHLKLDRIKLIEDLQKIGFTLNI